MKNKKILIIDDSPEVIEILTMYLEGESNLNIITAGSGNEAIDILEENQNFEFIMCDYKMDDGDGADVFQYHIKKNLQIPLYILSGEDDRDLRESERLNGFFSNNKVFKTITKPFKRDDIVKVLNTETISTISKKEYNKVDLKKLHKYLNTKIDAFIKIGESNYVRFLKKDEEFPKEILKKYMDKDISYAYLKEDDYTEFIRASNKSIIELLKKDNIKDSSKFTYEVVEAFHESIRAIGGNDEAKFLMEKSMDQMLQLTKSNVEIHSRLKDIAKRRGYIYDLSLLTGMMATIIVKKLDWSSENIIAKLVKAALLCDISLSEESYAKIKSLAEIENGVLDESEKQMILDHPQISLSLIESITENDMDWKNLILEHHELPDGSGFPKGLKADNIRPLSCVFIFAYNFSSKLIENQDLSINGMKKVFFEMKDMYDNGNFRDIFRKFGKSLKINL